MIARTRLGRTCAVALSFALSQLAVPLAQAADVSGTAASHLVSQEAMVAQLVDAARSREAKVRLFQEALDTPEAQARARSLGVDPARVRLAVAHLSDRELNDLSERAKHVSEVTAGHYHDSHDALVILGIVLLVAAIVVIAVASSSNYDDGCYCY